MKKKRRQPGPALIKNLWQLFRGGGRTYLSQAWDIMDQRKAAAAAAAENKWRIININAAVFGNEIDMNWS